MKKYLIMFAVIVFLLLTLTVVGLRLIGISVTDVNTNLGTGSAIAAKLACSAYHLSGMPKSQASQEIYSYAPLGNSVRVDFSRNDRLVAATLFRTTTKTATFRPGLGCTINNGDTSALDNLMVAPMGRPSDAAWPLGDSVSGINPLLQQQVKEIIARDNATGYQTRALIAVSQGRIVAEAYARGFDSRSQLLGWSMGKSLTAVLLGHLHFRNQLDVDETGLFRQWQADSRNNISVQHLLNMSSGLDFNENYLPGSDATHMLFMANSSSSVALASSVAHPPGHHFDYSSGTTNVLMQLLANRLGGNQALLDFLVQQIYQPLRLHRTTFEVDPSGLPVGSSYLYASARDWARMGLLWLNRGTLNGTRLMSEEWVSAATTPNTSNNFRAYGYHLWLNRGDAELRWPQLPADAYAMSGNRHQSVLIVPSRQVVLVRLGWTSGRYPMAENYQTILNALAADP